MKYVGIAALLLLLVGCGGDPQPKFSPSPTVSSSTTATAPAVETPEEFIRRWYRVSDRMELTGKTKAFDGLHTKACGDCETYAASIRGFYATGKHIVGSRTTVVAMTHLRGSVWRVDTKSAPTSIRDHSGRVTGQFPGGLSTYRVGLAHRLSGWRVTSYIRLGASA